jgi:hypothetical protein
MDEPRKLRRVADRSAICATGLLLAGMLSGCLVIGVSNRGGWFIWPRGFGFLLILVLLVFLLRRRR